MHFDEAYAGWQTGRLRQVEAARLPARRLPGFPARSQGTRSAGPASLHRGRPRLCQSHTVNEYTARNGTDPCACSLSATGPLVVVPPLPQVLHGALPEYLLLFCHRAFFSQPAGLCSRPDCGCGANLGKSCRRWSCGRFARTQPGVSRWHNSLEFGSVELGA